MLLSLLLLHEDLLLHVLGIAGQTVGVEVVVALGLCECFFLLESIEADYTLSLRNIVVSEDLLSLLDQFIEHLCPQPGFSNTSEGLGNPTAKQQKYLMQI